LGKSQIFIPDIFNHHKPAGFGLKGEPMKANPLLKLGLSGRWPIFLLLGTLMGSNFVALPVQAAGVVGTGTPATCTESAFDTALTGGGSVTFNCGGLKTITVTKS
jgi:hypothetical protein